MKIYQSLPVTNFPVASFLVTALSLRVMQGYVRIGVHDIRTWKFAGIFGRLTITLISAESSILLKLCIIDCFFQGHFELDRTSCEQCPVGTYNDKTGSSGERSCLSCPEGSVADSPGSETCTECQPVSLSGWSSNCVSHALTAI